MIDDLPPRCSVPARADRRHALRRLAIAIIMVALPSSLLPADAFNYSVEIRNFNRSIYADKTSRFRLSSADQDFTLISTGYQKIVSSSVSGGRKNIELLTGEMPYEAFSGEDRSAYLADTRFLNLTSPEITNCAARLKHSTDQLADTERFVNGHITVKDIGIPIIPAVQVYRMKQGDCTEHTVLAVAILRKLGIPARAVVGMYLASSFRGARDVFVYHMWAEAYAGGRWRLVDAANPGGKALNRYIAFAGHNLKSELPLSYLRAVSAIQELTVTYLGR